MLCMSLDSAKGGLYMGVMYYIIIGVIKGDTRSLDYSSYVEDRSTSHDVERRSCIVPMPVAHPESKAHSGVSQV